jgi:hypothetical protein
MFIRSNESQWGTHPQDESKEEFTASFVDRADTKVPVTYEHMGEIRHTTYPAYYLIEDFVEELGRDVGIGIGFRIWAFTWQGQKYVASTAAGDQPLTEVYTAEDWNNQVQYLLV